MLDKIIKSSIDNKLIVGLMMLMLVVWGGYSLMQLPIDAVPDITNNQVQVITTSPSLAAEEVERLITFPVEITMATIPKIEEIRSFSRFGLSVVTIVFEERADVYWARQQVSERLPDVISQIPPGVGQPSLAPITTGLGEIYQYVIGTEPGYEDRYTARDLRTIQDWIVRRQLLGTPGVADVSSFGGELKQYEIAINPDKLKSMNVTISDIFSALEENNENTGGAYIEKHLSAYFIRSEGLVGSLDDINQILIKSNDNGIPILIKDVAEVQIGSAVRYGATTRNGEGEVVSAIVMMLKGANSADVISNVKERIEDIRKTLPEGVTIEPFLDRDKLVNTAIGTVTTNLTEGALIVIFVLLLLLGNFRAGLIVASVIPLSLIFAFGMMNLFGVSANLMSLGAIDFGLIVDGAVIIVEATLHHLGLVTVVGGTFTQAEMDREVYRSASKIRKSAAFGEIIILIVYLPILALVGTEGKMFGPMAQTVSFAIFGAFILSLTYVPMMSALFLSKKTNHNPTISDRLIAYFQRIYTPSIKWSMSHRISVLASVLILFVGSLWLFSRLGGEFIPTLEEGDFAVETRVITGSSLKNTIAATTQAEKIILEQFPEAEQVVAKIGAGEIPTDPMPIEAADLMIILKPKDEWTSASTRVELANLMSEALEAIPGVNFGFQQPIQMRFNELMTGVRQDVAVKIYGEDLDDLSSYAQQIGNIAQSVEGAVDHYVEEVTGVPQIVVRYKRDQLAKYGLSIRDVNQSVQTAFAGSSAGLVFDNERRFDLVIRLEESIRQNLDAVHNLLIARKDGHQIPLYQVAEVVIEDGPYQIQRDNTRRRIIVAFNVRDRDVESVVKELQGKIEESVILSPGYSITYGGQFENLVEARTRLSYAVPMALLLIFVLLYFTFNSIKQSLLIFTAIPFAAIGGVIALWIRDMPFSISAGVGFIALFGVAVLNGIVLIAEFNRLKKDGVNDIMDRVFKGTSVRLRPVLMTGAVASLGFVPMALSESGGAEVQRPLATVVIGGLITATMLTLIVLPILYYYFEKGWKAKINRTAMTIVLLIAGFGLNAQTVIRSSDEAVKMAVEYNPTLQAAALNAEALEKRTGTGWDLPKTQVGLNYGQTNSVYDNDSRISISQTLAFPTQYANERNVLAAQQRSGQLAKATTENELKFRIRNAWNQLSLEKSRHSLLLIQDSIYARFAAAANLRFETGETNLLEKVTAEAQVASTDAALERKESDVSISETAIMMLINAPENVSLLPDEISPYDLDLLTDTLSTESNPRLAWFAQELEVSNQQTKLEKSKALPDLTLGYFNQSFNGPGETIEGDPIIYESSDRFTGFQVGLAIPIFGLKSNVSAIKAADLARQRQQKVLESGQIEVQGQLKQFVQELQKFKTNLDYYQTIAIPQAELILNQAQKGFDGGEIGYVEYIQGLQRSLMLQFEHLDAIHQYNQTINKIAFVTGSF